ncbi:hypothetical protein OE88DRAFT_1674725 [Heliocybe sulcata]|uniref:Mediator complex subunit 16 C-terminal domain-containing protein n=1 Tax=Heliocybe sulcata TaxID=5364 RepID=A0A5C3NCV4_9AGAM|nr:hypothetical protein OE88DRAFT_1674725 [Heliocybe sulcata]
MMSSPAMIANEFKTSSPRPKHERLSLGSSWKGKAKEDRSWQLEWWDLCSLADGKPPPVAWSQSSSIFTAHSSEAKVIGHLFPSSKPYVLPSPQQILAAPLSYQPPTVISVDASGQWLFAYFPGKDGEGIACLWKKGAQVDDWRVKESWTYPRGAGIIAACWINQGRQCIVQESGSLARLSPLGPPTPHPTPTLILVSEAYQVHVCFLRHESSKLKVLTCSLASPSSMSEGEPLPPLANEHNLGGARICDYAAIGLAYEESSIVVALRSHVLPLQPGGASYHEMDLNMLNVTQPISAIADAGLALEWEIFGQAPTIDLCEVQFEYDGVEIRLSTTPLPSISHSYRTISSMTFIPASPSHTTPDPTVSPALSVRSTGSMKKESDSGSVHGENRSKLTPLYLVVSALDFGDYTSTPKSELAVYTLQRGTTISSGSPSWSSHLQASRSFTSGVVAFATPPPLGMFNAGVLLGILDTSGIVPKNKAQIKHAPIGNLEFLRLSDLSNNDKWERCHILGDVTRLGQTFPQSAVISPNYALLCTISGSTRTDAHPAVYPLPVPLTTEGNMPALRLSTHISRLLLASVYSQGTPSDITYLLSLPSTPLPELEESNYATLSAFNGMDDGLWDMWLEEILGVAMESYRARVQITDGESAKQDLSLRWQAAHDALSLAACSAAFEDCRDGDGYDLNAVWGLVGICDWSIRFVEKLMRECILSNPSSSVQLKEEERDDLFGSNPPSPATERDQFFSLSISPTLLHLVHPYMLGKLVDVLGHIKALRTHLISLPAGGEHAHLAKSVFLDIFDSSAVNIPGLHGVLESLSKAPQSVSGDVLLRSLACCKPTISSHTSVRQAVLKVLDAQVVDKPQLFIKPTSLLHGLSKLSISDEDPKEKERDVLTKGVLSNNDRRARCVRCGGLSEAAKSLHSVGQPPDRWRAWEGTWTLHCICGGLWSNI